MALCIIALFSVPAVYSAGQSQGTAHPGTQGTGTQNIGTQGFAFDAISTMNQAVTATEQEFTPQDEYYLGRAVAANILASYRPYTGNPELSRYLNLICQTLAINSSKPVLFNGYSVMILDSAEFNAFATPGGHIFLTKKLIETATSEDMLAAIIAHELAHIMLHHGTGIIDEMRLMDDMSATANRASGIAGSQSAAANQAAYFRSSVTSSIDTMMKNGYSQTQEFEADKEAVSLLAASGYNPMALVEILAILQRVQPSQSGGFNTTHPSPAMRISSVQPAVNRYRIQDTSSYRVSRFKNK